LKDAEMTRVYLENKGKRLGPWSVHEAVIRPDGNLDARATKEAIVATARRLAVDDGALSADEAAAATVVITPDEEPAA
jgi:hypothetical protein